MGGTATPRIVFPPLGKTPHLTSVGVLAAWTLLASAVGFVTFLTTAPPVAEEDSSHATVGATLKRLPLYFIANKGQVDGPVDYYVQGSDAAVYFTPKGVTFALTDESADETARRWAVKLGFVGADRVAPVGRERTDATVSYFKGSKDEWRTALPTYSEVVYYDLWPGIDLVYSGTGGALKYSFVVHPGGDPSDIRLAYRGATSVEPTATGALRITTPMGGFTDGRPRSYQRVGGRRVTVPSSYALGPALLEGRAYGFQVGDYDRSRTLVIDPVVLIYAGYIGGSGSDFSLGVAIDSSNNAYVTGVTTSTETTFPATGGPDLTHNGGQDAFVAKVNASGSALVYAGYIGGSGGDAGWDIAVDSSGNAYVVGPTGSTETTFPVTGGPDLTHNGGQDAFVAKVNAAGNALVYSGYIGGSGEDAGFGIAVDSSGNAYVSGRTGSTEATFPVIVGPDLTHNGGNADAFVAKVNATGSALVYAGYIGGSGDDEGRGMVVDSSNNAYITGSTSSTEATFPVTVGPDLTYNGGQDAFVAQVNATGSALAYAGYFGGSGGEGGLDIAVDSSNNAYVTGFTSSTEATFPVTGGPDLTYNGDPNDAFVAKVNAAGSALVYAGYIGGSGNDSGNRIAIDSSGNAYVAGGTSSTEATFPVTGGPDLTHNGGTFDAFVAKVNAAGSALAYAGYIGGSDIDVAEGIAVDSSGNAYVSGQANSNEATFPATGGPDLTHNGGTQDVFVAKVQVQHNLTVTKAGSGTGTVTSSPAGIDCGSDCSEDYAEGTSVTLTATAASGSSFSGWSGDCSGTGTCALTVVGSKAVTATFSLIPPPPSRTLTVTKTGSGSGTVTGPGIDCGIDCTETYADGTAITLTATPAPGSTFGSWSGCDAVSANQCTVTMTSDRTATASFVAQRALTVTKAGTGSGTVTSSPAGINCGTDCTETYADGTMVTLTATAASGSTFGSWSGCGAVSGNQCTVTMTSDRTVTASFDAIPVVHQRTVSLRLRRHLVARGRVRVADGFDACAADVTVKIQRRTDNGWVTLKKLSTQDDGRFRARLKDRAGRYRARAVRTELEGGLDICGRVTSPVKRHKRR